MRSLLQQKILLILLGGIALGFSYTPQRQWRVLNSIAKEWEDIDRKALKEEIRKLYRSHLVKKQEHPDGSITFVLANKGKLQTLTYKFEKIKVDTPKHWDGKWRIVIFDIPEKLRKGRDALRGKLLALGFIELQKSVLVFPFECEKEIEFIVEFFSLKPYVRYGILEYIDNALHLKQRFQLIKEE